MQTMNSGALEAWAHSGNQQRQAVCKEQEQNNTLLKQAISDLGASGRSGLQQMNEELSAPWLHASAGKRRGKMCFIAALDVHRAFIENNPVKWPQYGAYNGLVKRLKTDRKTGGSGSRLLISGRPGYIKAPLRPCPGCSGIQVPKMIGWLLIDEAGQAQPSACGWGYLESKTHGSGR